MSAEPVFRCTCMEGAEATCALACWAREKTCTGNWETLHDGHNKPAHLEQGRVQTRFQSAPGTIPSDAHQLTGEL